MGIVAPLTRTALRNLLDDQQQQIIDLEGQLATAQEARAALHDRALAALAAKDQEIQSLRQVVGQQDETLQQLYAEFGSVKAEIQATNDDFTRQMAELNAEFTATIEEKNRQLAARDNQIMELMRQAKEAKTDPGSEEEVEAPKPRRAPGKKRSGDIGDGA